MVNLPRNKVAKGIKTRLLIQKNIGATNESNLETICEKHNVKPLEFRSAKLVNQKGHVTFLEHKQIRANMKASVMIIKYGVSDTNTDVIYDLFQIALDKKVKENKQKAKDIKDAVQHFELEKDEVDDPILTEVTETTEQVETVPALEAITDAITETLEKKDELFEQIKANAEALGVTVETVDTTEETSKSDSSALPDRKMEKKRQEDIKKRDQAIRNVKQEMEKKANQNNRNKHHRNFIADLHSKFGSKLTELPDYKFIELRKNASDLVIEHSEVYKIDLGAKDTYLLVIGDVNMKREVARQIDPAYEADSLIDEYDDFLQRIKAKEGVKTTVHDTKAEIDSDLEDDEEVPELEPVSAIQEVPDIDD